MTDRQIAEALEQAKAIERQARETWHGLDRADLAERDAALVVIRKSAELVAMLERWIVARATRAALTHN